MALILTRKFLVPLLLAVLGAGFLSSSELYAHGALIEHTATTGIRLQAKYDTGQPMSGAQITIYAPNAPTIPWLTGTADEAGRFSFVPDPDQPGTWSLQTRRAGHGAIIHVPIDNHRGTTPQQTHIPDDNAGQRSLMALSVIWGCVGTALYFKRRKHT